MGTVDFSLMYVTDDRIKNDDSFFGILEASLRGGATIVQLREKEMSSRDFYHRAIKTKELCKCYSVPFIVNDRLDIALAAEADGIHVGQKDLPAYVVRHWLGNQKIIGLSVSNEAQAREANNLAINYIGLSPIFSTQTKTSDLDQPSGLEGLKAIRSISKFPIVSIGGVQADNAQEVIENGSNGIAVVSAISAAKNPLKATQELKQIVCQPGTQL